MTILTGRTAKVNLKMRAVGCVVRGKEAISQTGAF